MADEVEVGRLDSLFSAKRYRGDPQVRWLCQTVVPVSGLLAQVGMTLREAKYAALAQVTTAPRDEAEGERVRARAGRSAGSAGRGGCGTVAP